MQRIAILVGIGCLALICTGGMWLAFRPPLEALLPPDATDIDVVDVGWWEWTLTYRTSGPAYQWYGTVAHQLQAARWVRIQEWPLRDSETYTRITWYKFVVFWERAELNVDSHGAHVRMRRWITLPWWP